MNFDLAIIGLMHRLSIFTVADIEFLAFSAGRRDYEDTDRYDAELLDDDDTVTYEGYLKNVWAIYDRMGGTE